MGYYSSLDGTISGLPQAAYEKITSEQEAFDELLRLESGDVFISAYGKLYNDRMYPVYQRIADALLPGGWGELTRRGENYDDVSTIFFIPEQFEEVWCEMSAPANPFMPAPAPKEASFQSPLLLPKKEKS